MNEFAFPPKYSVGDLVLYTFRGGQDWITTLGIVVKVEPSIINDLPMFYIHMPTGNQGLAFQSELEFASVK